MSGCTATIIVDGQTITCTSHDDLSMYRHSDGLLGWSDLAPGATPARERRYRAVPMPAHSWGVMDGYETVAYFSWYSHPDPQGAAEAEAARLNGGDDPSHDDCQQAVSERDAARAARDRYREALEKIAGTELFYSVHTHRKYARSVLDEVDA